jgi:hypothetical protein
MINFNMHYLSVKPEDWEGNVDTAVHEILRILGMSSGLFPYFIDENGNTRSNVV